MPVLDPLPSSPLSRHAAAPRRRPLRRDLQGRGRRRPPRLDRDLLPPQGGRAPALVPRRRGRGPGTTTPARRWRCRFLERGDYWRLRLPCSGLDLPAAERPAGQRARPGSGRRAGEPGDGRWPAARWRRASDSRGSRMAAPAGAGRGIGRTGRAGPSRRGSCTTRPSARPVPSRARLRYADGAVSSHPESPRDALPSSKLVQFLLLSNSDQACWRSPASSPGLPRWRHLAKACLLTAALPRRRPRLEPARRPGGDGAGGPLPPHGRRGAGHRRRRARRLDASSITAARQPAVESRAGERLTAAVEPGRRYPAARIFLSGGSDRGAQRRRPLGISDRPRHARRHGRAGRAHRAARSARAPPARTPASIQGGLAPPAGRALAAGDLALATYSACAVACLPRPPALPPSPTPPTSAPRRGRAHAARKVDMTRPGDGGSRRA